MEPKERMVELINKQIRLEQQVENSVEKQLEVVDTAAAKLLLTEMKHDARKHAAILQGILEVIADSAVQLWDYKINSYVDKQVVKRELERHMAIEQDTLNMVKEEIKQTDDGGMKLLLQHVAEDEDRHHALLRTIINHSYQINP